jgi:hypothetical protein
MTKVKLNSKPPKKTPNTNRLYIPSLCYWYSYIHSFEMSYPDSIHLYVVPSITTVTAKCF